VAMNSNDPPQGVVSGSNASVTLLGEEGSPFPSLDPQGSSPVASAEFGEPAEAPRLDLVFDIPVRLSVELGRTEIPIRDVVNFGRGSVIELDGSPGAPLEVRVNGVLIGRGEVVVIDEERLGLRFVEPGRAHQTAAVRVGRWPRCPSPAREHC
jgi:flagellar motor switch protein FliN